MCAPTVPAVAHFGGYFNMTYTNKLMVKRISSCKTNVIHHDMRFAYGFNEDEDWVKSLCKSDCLEYTLNLTWASCLLYHICNYKPSDACAHSGCSCVVIKRASTNIFTHLQNGKDLTSTRGVKFSRRTRVLVFVILPPVEAKGHLLRGEKDECARWGLASTRSSISGAQWLITRLVVMDRPTWQAPRPPPTHTHPHVYRTMCPDIYRNTGGRWTNSWLDKSEGWLNR